MEGHYMDNVIAKWTGVAPMERVYALFSIDADGYRTRPVTDHKGKECVLCYRSKEQADTRAATSGNQVEDINTTTLIAEESWDGVAIVDGCATVYFSCDPPQ